MTRNTDYSSQKNISSSPDSAAWNPNIVQNLINEAYKLGETPVVLCLGRLEAASLKNYLANYFDDGEVTSLKNQVYAGLKIVELKADSLLRVETLRSLYANSRHAEQKRIREAMENNRLYGSQPPPRP